MNQAFVIEPFNAVYIVFVGTVMALMAVLTGIIRKKDTETRRKIMVIFTSAVAVLLLFYKFSYRLDTEFINDYPHYWGEYTVFNELPFNPCNIVLLLFPAALWKKNDYLLSYCVYMGIISTLLAICMPQQGYAGYSIFQWHTFGFFLLHSLGVFIPVSVVVLGLYRPKYRDIFKAVTVLLICTAFSFLLSLALRESGLCAFANYSFTMDPEGNPVLELCYRLIPVKGLYLVCTLLIFCPACTLLITAYRGIERLSERRGGKREAVSE